MKSSPAQEPIVRPEPTPAEIALEATAVVGLLLSYYLVIDSWESLPESIPTHFGAAGGADAWGPKWTIFIHPMIGTLLYLGLTLLRRIPHRLNYPVRLTEANAERQIRLAFYLLSWIKLELVWAFTYIQWSSIEVAMQRAMGLGSSFLPLLLGTLFFSLAFYVVLAHRSR